MAHDQFLRWYSMRFARTRKSGRRVTRSMHMARQRDVTGIEDQGKFQRSWSLLLRINGMNHQQAIQYALASSQIKVAE